MLSKKAKDEFRALYEMEFGELLNDDKVEELETRLLRLFSIFTGGDQDGTSVPAQN